MRIRNAGKVTDGLWCLGSEESNIYLLEGDQESMIVSGGMSYLVPTLLEGIVYETPGHSSCSVSFYVPSIKALFPSDGGGIPYKEKIIASGNSNFTKYQESLEKLKDLDVEFMCADHYGYIIGEEAKNYIRESIQAARARRSEIEEVYLQSRDMEVATRELVERFYRDNPDYLLTPEIFAGVYHQMLRHIVEELE